MTRKVPWLPSSTHFVSFVMTSSRQRGHDRRRRCDPSNICWSTSSSNVPSADMHDVILAKSSFIKRAFSCGASWQDSTGSQHILLSSTENDFGYTCVHEKPAVWFRSWLQRVVRCCGQVLPLSALTALIPQLTTESSNLLRTSLTFKFIDGPETVEFVYWKYVHTTISSYRWRQISLRYHETRLCSCVISSTILSAACRRCTWTDIKTSITTRSLETNSPLTMRGGHHNKPHFFHNIIPRPLQLTSTSISEDQSHITRTPGNQYGTFRVHILCYWLHKIMITVKKLKFLQKR